MKKLNGYRPTHRNKWRFIQYGLLNVQELALLEFYADIFDFDKDHESFGLFRVNFNEIADVFRCKSDSTIRNWHKKLLDIGFIEPTSQRNVFKLKCFRRFIHSGYWSGKVDDYAKNETDQPFEIILQNFGIDPQHIGRNLQPVVNIRDNLASKSNVKALGSFKDESNVLKRNKVKKVIIKQEPRTEEEYQKIYRDNPQGLSPEDMRWIDENLQEEIEITDEETEKHVVETFFDGDWDKYRRNLVISGGEEK